MLPSSSLAIILPTLRSRRELAIKSLNFLISSQKVTFDLYVVTAEHDQDFSYLHEFLISNNINFFHLSSSILSAAEQRNVALHFIGNLSDKIYDYVFFMDDDILISLVQIEELILTAERLNADGISGVTKNYNTFKFSIVNLLRRMLLLSSRRPGVVTMFGINVEPFGKDTFLAEWLIGCSLWKFSSIKNSYFFSNFKDYTLGEDVIFSHTLFKKGFRLIVNSNILFSHLESPRILDELELKSRLLSSRLTIISKSTNIYYARKFFRLFLLIDFLICAVRNIFKFQKLVWFSKLYFTFYIRLKPPSPSLPNKFV